MLMTLHQNQRGLDLQQEFMTLTNSNLMLHFIPIRNTLQTLHCWLKGLWTGYMNLGRALFLRDLISDEEIDVCSHIFHILTKTVDQTTSRNCLPFFCLISRILKLKDVHPLTDECQYLSQVQLTSALSMPV